MMGIAWTFAGNVDQASRYFREVFDRRVAEGNPAAAAEVANTSRQGAQHSTEVHVNRDSDSR